MRMRMRMQDGLTKKVSLFSIEEFLFFESATKHNSLGCVPRLLRNLPLREHRAVGYIVVSTVCKYVLIQAQKQGGWRENFLIPL